jgi:hypothetical protein
MEYSVWTCRWTKESLPVFVPVVMGVLGLLGWRVVRAWQSSRGQTPGNHEGKTARLRDR